MAENLSPGDFLVFQLESGYGLLRVIAVEGNGPDAVWHVSAYDEFFFDVEQAEAAIGASALPAPILQHIALTNRAFESTQVAKLMNIELNDNERSAYLDWLKDTEGEVSDRSVRLMLGLR